MTQTLQPTASQTVGPFFNPPIKLDGLDQAFATGDFITLEGQLLDGAGAPIGDAMIEFWQADAQGHAANGSNTIGAQAGFARIGTDREGRFRLTTVKPGATPDAAPHIAVTVFARGLLRHLFTRVYFSADANDAVQKLAEARASTLVAQAVSANLYRWNIHVQGAQETVFFDF